MFQRFLFALLLVFAFTIPPACRTVNARLAPAAVLTAVDLRTDTLAAAQTALQGGLLDDAALLQLLADDEAAWGYLRENSGFTTSADLNAVLQTQQIGVRVAREKIAAGLYSPAEKLELVSALALAWSTLDTYYTPSEG